MNNTSILNGQSNKYAYPLRSLSMSLTLLIVPNDFSLRYPMHAVKRMKRSERSGQPGTYALSLKVPPPSLCPNIWQIGMSHMRFEITRVFQKKLKVEKYNKLSKYWRQRQTLMQCVYASSVLLVLDKKYYLKWYEIVFTGWQKWNSKGLPLIKATYKFVCWITLSF